MELKRIVGPDMRSALRMVRDQLGPDAIILSNRRTAAGVEIVAGPEEAWGGHSVAPQAEVARGDGQEFPASPAAQVAAAPEYQQSAPMVTAVVGNEIRGLHSELRDLREMLEQRFGEMHIDRMNWGPGNEGRAWRRLTRVGLPNELVHELVTHVDPRAPWEQAWAALRVRLAAGLLEAGDVVAGGGVIAVVGPTGAGKTTTIAKLAVRHVLEHGAAGLALASIDATRIGGSDALRALSRLLDVPFHAAREGEGVAELVARAGDCRLMLLDTAGINRRAARHLAQIAELGQLGDRVRTLLVLPANAQRAWVASALEDYRPALPVASVVTKLDETVSLGEVLGALHRARMPIAYVSDGPEIPDDLHVAQAAGLVAQAVALDPEAEEAPAPRAARPVVLEANAARIA